jgi:hypothetical protein
VNRRAFALGAAMVLLGNVVAVTLRAYAEAKRLETYGPATLAGWLASNRLDVL